MIVADPENVVAIHCNSGKGRAGTACTSLLLYSGFYDDIFDCAKLFGSRRFTDEKGVSQPCQLRFIHYFEAFYKNIIISPQLKIIKRINIIGVPNMGSGLMGTPGCKPYFQIYQVKGIYNELLYDNRTVMRQQLRFYFKAEGSIDLEIPGNVKLAGNIMI